MVESIRFKEDSYDHDSILNDWINIPGNIQLSSNKIWDCCGGFNYRTHKKKDDYWYHKESYENEESLKLAEGWVI